MASHIWPSVGPRWSAAQSRWRVRRSTGHPTSDLKVDLAVLDTSLAAPVFGPRPADTIPSPPSNTSSATFSKPEAAAWSPSIGARCFKRALDIVIATLGLLAALPALLLAAIAIKLDSHGPVLFTQWRTGAAGRRFRIYKLRTMAIDNDDSLHRAYVAALIKGEAGRHDGMFKLVGDPRITRVGRVLRRLSVDEVPQLWNVLRGDMSLVGPRPALPAEVELYDDRARQRLAAKPGITGLPQVKGRCELTFAETVELDLEYLHSWSVWLELKILLLTPVAIVSKKGAA